MYIIKLNTNNTAEFASAKFFADQFRICENEYCISFDSTIETGKKSNGIDDFSIDIICSWIFFLSQKILINLNIDH